MNCRLQSKNRGPCSKARELDSWTVVQPCIWFKEDPSQFYMGQTAQSLTSWRNYIYIGWLNILESYSRAIE